MHTYSISCSEYIEILLPQGHVLVTGKGRYKAGGRPSHIRKAAGVRGCCVGCCFTALGCRTRDCHYFQPGPLTIALPLYTRDSRSLSGCCYIQLAIGHFSVRGCGSCATTDEQVTGQRDHEAT